MGKRIKDLTSLSLPINNNDKILIERSDKSYNANISDILSTKQDTISDLDTIRNGASLGATALQAVPDTYVTKSELEGKKYLTSVPSEYVTETELSAKKYLTSVPSEYITETELNSKNFATVSGVDTKINGLDATISGNSTHVTIKITEENGKLSSLNVTESGIASANDLESVSSAVTTIQNSVGENTSSKTLSERVNILENKCDKLDSKANVLWVGTSIPAGNVVDGVPNNYPKMVADALGFNLYNNSIGASFLTFYPNNGYVNDESYNWQKKADIKEHVGYCLSATKQQVEDKFRPILQRIKSNDSTMTDADIEHYIGVWKWASYEDRIIPYIDGTIASCDTVIIDHGYNDRDNIVASAGNYADETLDYSSLKDDGSKYPDPSKFRGWYFINHLGDRDYYKGELYMNGCCYEATVGSNGMKHEYMGALTHIIMAIKKVNPNIKIIIGNYFAQRNPYQDDLSPYVTKANEGVAKWFSLQCVNVYQYTGLINKSYTDKNGITEKDFNRFCPDGVHPHSDSTGHSNRIIANIYINQLRGIV